MQVRKSLHLKIVFASIFTMGMTIIIILTYIYATNVRVLKKHAVESNMKDLHMISDKMDTYLNMLELVSAFTYEKDIQSFIERTDCETALTSMRRLRSFQEFYSKRLISLNFEGQIKDIYFIYPDGEVLHKGDGIYDETYDFTKEGWYKQTVNELGRTVVVDTHRQVYNMAYKSPEMRAAREKYCVSLARRVDRVGGNTLLGVLMMDIDIMKMTDIFGSLLLSAQSKIYFSDASGNILYSVNKEEIGTPLLAEFANDFSKQSEGSLNGSFSGNDSVIAWLKSPKTGWYLTSINPTELIVSDIFVMQRNIVLVAIAAFTLTILLILSYAGKIFNPVKKLTDAMLLVEQGNLNIKVPVLSEDEIGYLSSAFNHMLEKIQALINDNYLSRLKEKDAQIESLQLQINPHFLYNTLESVNCIAMLYDAEEISIISKSLASMFRYSIQNAKNVVSVAEELNHIRSYMNILKIRFGDKVHVSYEIETEVENYQVIPLVLQPLIENAVKYSVEEKGMYVHIRIIVAKQGDQLYFCVEDDGTGIDDNRLNALTMRLNAPTQSQYTDKKKHIGLINIHNRLRLHYGEAYGLNIESEAGNYTRVSFFVPCT